MTAPEQGTQKTISRSETEEVTTRHTAEGDTETRTHAVKEEVQQEAPPQPQEEVETVTTTTVIEY